MKKIYLLFFVAFCVFYSCGKNSNYKEFKVDYEEKTETFQKEGSEGKYKIAYPHFKDYPEFNEILKKTNNINIFFEYHDLFIQTFL